MTVVLSSISVVSSTKSCSIRVARMFSHTPAFVHARKRLYTLCHGPNRSGRSRHGTPVFSQYSIALSISWLLFPGRPPCGFLSGGNSSLIFFHFSSLISCRLMCPILSLLSALLNTQVLKQALGRVPKVEVPGFFVGGGRLQGEKRKEYCMYSEHFRRSQAPFPCRKRWGWRL